MPPFEFLFGLEWEPQEFGNKGFGAIPLFVGTILITLIAMSLAVPLGILSAITLSEYAIQL